MSLTNFGVGIDLNVLPSLISEIHNFVKDSRGREGRLFLVAHHEAFRYTLPNGEMGTVRLSEWWICWSVKWYSDDNQQKQIIFVDGVNKDKAEKYFYKLKQKLDDLGGI
jgi:hypothetical protein